MRIYLGLGANLGDRAGNLSRALGLLGSKALTVRRVSPVVESPALLPDNAPAEWNLPFLNLVVECETDVAPEVCLEWIDSIHSAMERSDGAKWAPRPIDIDILLWGREQLQTENLTIPHPRMQERNFVLTPMIALSPRMTIPGLGRKTLLEWSRELSQHLPLWMGILNVTPDSFSDGNERRTWDEIEPHVDAMIKAGAHIIDVGGESTRPGAAAISADTEWQRIGTVLSELVASRQGSLAAPLISVDSYHASTIERALSLGVDIVNDVTGLTSPELLELAKGSDADWVAMHSVSVPVDPKNKLPVAADGYREIEDALLRRLETWDKAGLDLNRIILDPGIGFGKDNLQSLRIMANASELRKHGQRVLVGHSRKSFLNQISGTEIEAKDLATLGMSLKLCEQGVDILRVHNVPLHTAAYRGWSHLSSL
jgi:dihydropteroate synthase/2-amino-4-hydroxy-6-hydroxymethyldihydropteridine diphosphokinase